METKKSAKKAKVKKTLTYVRKMKRQYYVLVLWDQDWDETEGTRVYKIPVEKFTEEHDHAFAEWHKFMKDPESKTDDETKVEKMRQPVDKALKAFEQYELKDDNSYGRWQDACVVIRSAGL
jgi:hypothetical protein